MEQLWIVAVINRYNGPALTFYEILAWDVQRALYAAVVQHHVILGDIVSIRLKGL